MTAPEPLLELPEHEGTDLRCYARTTAENGEDEVVVRVVQVNYDAGEKGEVHLAASRDPPG